MWHDSSACDSAMMTFCGLTRTQASLRAGLVAPTLVLLSPLRSSA